MRKEEKEKYERDKTRRQLIEEKGERGEKRARER